ncbi:MAG: hypothetical protein J0L51_07745 [Rhizobiales bacterium]|nr:hypothetical protein [Hyphomicrobiales bacterium]
MSQTSFLETHPPLVNRLRLGRTGLWLSAVLALAVAAVGSGIFLAPASDDKAAIAAPADKVTNVAAPTQPPLALPGFQRRGPLLTGEVKTVDGSTLRLVIDTRSHAIIGYRLVEPAAR